MLQFLSQARLFVWSFIELAFAAVLALMLVYLILGEGAGGFVTSVAGNVIKLMNDIPAGNLAALAIVGALLYWLTHRTKVPADR
jgi:hypothetical protein